MHEELEIQGTLGRSSWGGRFLTRFEASLALKSRLGHHGEGELARERREREVTGESESEGERE